MKCSRCGKRFNSLPAIAKHYRKKHPGAMKRKAQPKGGPKQSERSGNKFCPHCGGFLG